MSKFKAGDKVVRIGMTWRGIKWGKEYEIRSIESRGDLYLKDHSFICHESQYELVYSCPNPPHAHAEYIKAWADGANIEFKDTSGDWWPVAEPSWLSKTYRIKPTKSDKDIKIEELEAKLLEIHKELGELKGE